MPDRTKNPEGTGPITDAKVTTQTRLLDGLARSHVIELKEDDPALPRELLIARYASSDDDTVSGDNKLDSNARTCAMADKYDIAFLKTLSECMPQAQLDGLTGDDMSRFLQAVRTIDTTTSGSDRGLRDLLVPVLKKYGNTLNEDGFLKSGLADGDLVRPMRWPPCRYSWIRSLSPPRSFAPVMRRVTVDKSPANA